MGVGGTTAQPTGWKQQIGTLAHVSAGDDGEIWGLTQEQQIRRWNDGEWQPVGGSLKQISVGSVNHIWAVNHNDQVFRWVGEWQEMPGRLRWVSAASDGTVVGVNANEDIFRWNGGGWEQLDGKLVLVSVASRKVMYGVNRSRQIFRWNGGGWDFVGGESRGHLSVAIREHRVSVWAQLLSAPASGSVGETYNLFESIDGGPWQARDSLMSQFSVAAQYIVGVRPDRTVHSWGHGLPATDRPLVTRQRGWRWCARCQSLVFGGHETRGNCPARALGVAATKVVPHDFTGSGEYALANSDGAPGQAGWRWCRKCESLFFGEHAGGKCTSGGTHDGSQSGAYTVAHDDANAPGQDGWRWCLKCESLFFAGGGATRCSAGAEHDGSHSGAYRVFQIG